MVEPNKSWPIAPPNTDIFENLSFQERYSVTGSLYYEVTLSNGYVFRLDTVEGNCGDCDFSGEYRPKIRLCSTLGNELPDCTRVAYKIDPSVVKELLLIDFLQR